MGRTDASVTKGSMLKGMGMGLMGASCKPELCIVAISTKGAELSKMVGGVRPRA